MFINNFIPRFDLQLFADGGAAAGGGDGGTGAEGTTGVTATDTASQTKGVKNPLANVKYGKQPEDVSNAEAQTNTANTEAQQVDRAEEFEKLIKGEYKDLYDSNVQNIVQNRLKNSKETAEKFEKVSPLLDMLAQKYGVKPGDLDSLRKAVEEDDAYYEAEALEKGCTVEFLKQVKKTERENAELRAARERSLKQEIYSRWQKQSEEMKSIYPTYDFDTEMQNKQFSTLLANNVDVRTAYEVVHKDEIIPAAMQFTAQKVKENFANEVRANGARPSENGTGGQSAAVIKRDVSKLSLEDREEIVRRVQRGEKISF